MLVYWINCIISCIFMKLADLCNKSNKEYYRRKSKKLAFVASLPLILVAALRYDVGMDYMYTYVPYFKRVLKGGTYEKLEPLYHYINVLVQKFTDDYAWVFAICAVIFISLIYIRIMKDSPYPELSVFLLVGATYYFIFLNTQRQMVGVAICVFSLAFVQQRKPIHFFISVLIASGFHSSCIVFLAFYFISNVKFDVKSIFIVTAIVLFTSEFLADKINELVASTMYSEYQNSRFDTSEQGYVVLAMNVLILVFAAMYRTKDNKYQIYLNLQLVATWIALLTGKVVLLNRLRWLFGIPMIILLPMAVSNIKQIKVRTLAYLGLIVLYFIYAQYTIGVMNGNTVLPYRTIFSR